MRVVFFHRKPRTNFNFSVENLFKQIREALPDNVQWKVKELKYHSDGFFKRLYIGFQAALNQSEVNHVTGDINFVAIFLKRRKTVLTILDVGFMKHSNKVARLILKYFWIVFPVKRCAVVTTISQATKEELLKYVKLDPEKVKVIYVPISAAFIPRGKKFNKTEPTILQIGTKANKNVSRLVKALKGIPCTLDIVGEINEELLKELKDSGVNYSASKNISQEEVISKYYAADLLAFVSTYEGFGMPIVEANAIGRVVVTSNLLSMPEVAGDAAHFVDPFNVKSIREGILKVIEDDHYREELINKGYKNRLRFDENEIANQFNAIYTGLVQGNRIN